MDELAQLAADRVPWMGQLWPYVDLQVDLRGGALRSSLTEDGVLPLKRGNHFKLAVLFFDATGQVVDEVERLSWALRDGANIELIASASDDNPTAQTDKDDPYFVLEPDTQSLGDAALDLRSGDAADLLCVCDVEWQIDGQVYSSQNLPVRVDLGLVGKQSAMPSTPTPTTPTTPTPPTTPPPPTPQPPTPPPAPPGLTATEVRALFDRWISEILPSDEGFLYVRDSQFHSAVPGGDCGTGETWNPS